MRIQVTAVLEVDDGGPVCLVTPLAARETFRKYLMTHSPERHLEILHARRVNDRVEESLQDDETVNSDADTDNVSVGRALDGKNAVFTVDDEPNDGRHPAHDERTHYQQRRDDCLNVFFNTIGAGAVAAVGIVATV